MNYTSIIMPVYNVGPWVKDALESVLSQSFTNFECIVINDGSTDDTVDIVKSFADKRIKLFSQANKGVSSARNNGMSRASGEYIVFLDGDDIWPENTLKDLLSPFLNNLSLDFVWGNYLRFNDITKMIIKNPWTSLQHTENARDNMIMDNFMSFGAIAVRASKAKRYLFNEDIVIGEDRDWLIRVLEGSKVFHLNKNIHFYRQREASATCDIELCLEEHKKMLSVYLELPDIPEKVKNRSRSSLAFHAATLLAKMPGKKIKALKKYLEAIYWDPLYLESYLRPLRKILWLILPKEYFDPVSKGVKKG